MSLAALAQLEAGSRRIRQAREALAPHPPPGSVESVLAHRLDEIVTRCDQALRTYADEAERARHRTDGRSWP